MYKRGSAQNNLEFAHPFFAPLACPLPQMLSTKGIASKKANPSRNGCTKASLCLYEKEGEKAASWAKALPCVYIAGNGAFGLAKHICRGKEYFKTPLFSGVNFKTVWTKSFLIITIAQCTIVLVK